MAGDRRRTATPSILLGELLVGCILLGIATLGGLLLIRRPLEHSLDAALSRPITINPNDVLYHRIADIGTLPFLLGGIAFAIAISIWRDFPRALACVVGPVVAVFVTEQVAKPYVGRHALLGGNSYPSGTVTAAAALVTVITLAVPFVFRPLVGVVALGMIGAVGIAVVGMEWHYPTDVIGGACVGVGSVLSLDALVHIPRCWRAERARRAPPAPETPRIYASARYG